MHIAMTARIASMSGQSPDGHRVEQVMAWRSLNRLRRRRGSARTVAWSADCRTIEEVALIVDLATRGAEAPHPR